MAAQQKLRCFGDNKKLGFANKEGLRHPEFSGDEFSETFQINITRPIRGEKKLRWDPAKERNPTKNRSLFFMANLRFGSPNVLLALVV